MTSTSNLSASSISTQADEQGAKFIEAMQRGIDDALGCTRIDFRSPLKVYQAANQIARFAVEALCDAGFVIVRKPLAEAAPDMLEALQELRAEFRNCTNDILSACDASNWDFDRNKGDYFRGLNDAYTAISETISAYIDTEAKRKASAAISKATNS